MKCNGCREEAYHTRTYADGTEVCDRCGDIGTVQATDVYFKRVGESNENITDERGVPVEFHSRGHKARYMREHNLREVGDRVHGAPYSLLPNQDIRPGPQETARIVRDAVRKAKQDLRRKYGR